MTKHTGSRDQLRAREGCECIFLEMLIVVAARVERVTLSKWGVEVAMVNLDRPGFTRWPQAEFTVSAAWNFFGDARDKWSGAYAGWSIWFEPALVSSVTRLAASLSNAPYVEGAQALRKELFAHARRTARRANPE